MPNVDVLVVGGGLGGVAAAKAAAEAGKSVTLVETSQWLGGQMSGQGVCTPDEAGVNKQTVMDTCGATQDYSEFRKWVRNDYAGMGMNGAGALLGTPGDNWTSNDGFGVQATRAHAIYTQWLQTAGVTVMLGARVSTGTLQGRIVTSVTVTDSAGNPQVFTPTYILDATDTGQLLPLLNLPSVIGAEINGFHGETNPAQTVARPDWIQPITYPFAVEYRPGNTTPSMTDPPTGYDPTKFQMFSDCKTLQGEYDGFLTYRRVISHALFPAANFPFDISLVNVSANDYTACIYPTNDPDADQQTLLAAQQWSQCFLYFIQHDAVRLDGQGKGYPEIVTRDDFFGNGYLAPLPYVRESRRIVALGYVIKDDILAPDQDNPGAQRAKLFPDSCGVGNYEMDVHSINADHCYYHTNPFQIRVSQLVPVDCDNLLAAGKCLGVTHITNGAFRLHPQEWNIGESAGALAAYCIDQNVTPATVATQTQYLYPYQAALLARGVPLFWWTDMGPSMDGWAAAQILGVRGIFEGQTPATEFLQTVLDFQFAAIMPPDEIQAVETRAGVSLSGLSANPTRVEVAKALASALNYL